MSKAGWLLVGAALLGGVGYAGQRVYAYQRCNDLERSFLKTVEGMRSAAATEPLARQYGSGGQVHQLAMKMNAKGMEYYIGQLRDECGVGASGEAIRKAHDIIG